MEPADWAVSPLSLEKAPSKKGNTRMSCELKAWTLAIAVLTRIVYETLQTMRGYICKYLTGSHNMNTFYNFFYFRAGVCVCERMR